MSDNDLRGALDGISNLLLSAPPLSAAESSACTEVMDFIDPRDMNVLAVTYQRNPDQWMSDFRAHFDAEPARIQIVSVKESTRGAAATTGESVAPVRPEIATVESPRDLTGLGIKINEYLKRADEAKWDTDATETLLCFDSVTALLQYVEIKRAFRFLHVMTNQVSALGANAHYHIHPSALGEQQLHTIQPLFDGIATVGENGISDIVTE